MQPEEISFTTEIKSDFNKLNEIEQQLCENAVSEDDNGVSQPFSSSSLLQQPKSLTTELSILPLAMQI